MVAISYQALKLNVCPCTPGGFLEGIWSRMMDKTQLTHMYVCMHHDLLSNLYLELAEYTYITCTIDAYTKVYMITINLVQMTEHVICDEL